MNIWLYSCGWDYGQSTLLRYVKNIDLNRDLTLRKEMQPYIECLLDKYFNDKPLASTFEIKSLFFRNMLDNKLCNL